jgi:hypothetical protein
MELKKMRRRAPPCRRFKDIGRGDHVIRYEQVPADVGGVAWLGSEMHHDFFT